MPILSSSLPSDDSVTDRTSSSSADWSIETPQPTQHPRPMSNPLIIPPEAVFLPSSTTVQKSRRTISHLTSARGRLIVIDSDSEDNEPEDELKDSPISLSEAEWLCRQQILSPVKRGSKQSEINSRWSATSSNNAETCNHFMPVSNKHMNWAVDRSQISQSRDKEDRYDNSLPMPRSFVHRPDENAKITGSEWI